MEGVEKIALLEFSLVSVRLLSLMPKPLLQLDSVSKSFQAVRALRNVSFCLQAGEVHAVW